MRKRYVVGAAAALAAACGGDLGSFAGEMVGDAGEVMADAGRALMDAGNALSDAGGLMDAAGLGDAQAHAQDASDGAAANHEPVTVECDVALTQVATAQSGYKTERTWYFAEIAVEGTPPIDVVICGNEHFGGALPNACPEGSTCTGDAYPGYGECQGTLAMFSGGKARVECGWRTRELSPGGDVLDGTARGSRRTSATFTVR
jgi:hypothetical protein